jgi:hypothetical protein
MTSRSRILIADDHKLVAELFMKIEDRYFLVVGIVGDGFDLDHIRAPLKPNLMLELLATVVPWCVPPSH